MPPQAASDQDEAPTGLPPPLAQQVALIRSQLDPVAVTPGADLVRYVDAGLLNLCELAEVSMDLLNRVLAMRTLAEQLGQAVDRAGSGPDPDRDRLHERALAELIALEGVLAHVRPSRATLAMGVGW